MKAILKYLGLDRSHLLVGYRRNLRSGPMPVCQRCGVLVAVESQELHADWHDSRQD